VTESMRNGRWLWVRIATITALALVLAPIAAGARSTNPHPPSSSVNGAVYTTTDPAVDGLGTCQNGNPHSTTPVIDCNIYLAKKFVWLSGGPTNKPLSPAGIYFFAVLNPGDQSNPNDPTAATANPNNLSCPTVSCTDPRSNRQFTVGSNGEISSYTGTHVQDATTYPGNGILIRLCAGTTPSFCPPYIDTPNPGGEYAMAVCYLGPAAGPLATTVTPSSCKYDNFKVKNNTVPSCQIASSGSDSSGFRFIKVTVGSSSGLQSIDVTRADNLTYTVSPAFVAGAAGTYTVYAKRTVKTHSAHLSMTLTDIFGNQTKCDPVAATLRSDSPAANRAIGRFTGLTQSESTVRVVNGSVGFSQVDVIVNGRHHRLGGLQAGETRKIDVRAAMKAGNHNVVVVRGVGRRDARADLLISE
jgi:hypothetical protein